ncbi:hypothetical protein [Flavobacterium piscis]|uniref:Nucleotidyltransferase n=1 Tax=Flavobacterium piscis TaxID=1114874 RepID=A0ABU1Y9N1_9FLAO|nr:hypothetical protein [Flavobacterium piscis]MDR7210251.1 putative nucleotidyltransferase [Flavobacterium piscis]
MKKNLAILILGLIFISCNNKAEEKKIKKNTEKYTMKSMEVNDARVSLKLNPMQKQHQLMNMRSHVEAVQKIVSLLAVDKYDEASVIAYEKLGTTTQMKLMCASFGNEDFENLGLEFHKSADKMSEIFKAKNKQNSLNALSNTMNYCVQCHATYKQ